MSEDGLFYEGDPFDDPAWKATEKAAKRRSTKLRTSSAARCPGLNKSFRMSEVSIRSSLRCCYIAGGCCVAGAGRSTSPTVT